MNGLIAGINPSGSTELEKIVSEPLFLKGLIEACDLAPHILFEASQDGAIFFRNCEGHTHTKLLSKTSLLKQASAAIASFSFYKMTYQNANWYQANAWSSTN
jgi:hypothetical protein